MAQTAARQVARERERFLSSGGVPARVRAEISSSWRRCRSWSVPADGFALPYRPDLDPESPLLRAARPVLDSLVERLGDLQISVLLTDADARILDRRVRQRSLLGLLDARKIVPGFVFAEDVAGTNGLGTAIELGRTTRIDGHEHYASDLVGFTCVGVPITDPIRRRCVGVLDVTCAADPDNRLVTLVAEQTARAIESRLVAQHSRREQALLARFLATSRSGHGGVVVVGERVVMTNPPAARLLEGVDQALLWDGAARAAAGAVWAELTLADGRVARTRTTPLRDGGELVGALIELRPVDDPPRERRPSALGARPDPAPECRGTSTPPTSPPPSTVVGTDPAFLAAVRAVREAPVGRVVVLCGEPGVGKRELAMERDPAAREMDASAAVLDGEQAWLAALAGALAGPPEELVVRHLELLTPGALRTVAALLGTATARGMRCTATSSEASLLPGVDHEHVWLPPLRRRPGDVPALVAAFAAPVAVAPEVVQLLQRLAWPGNVRELGAAVRRIVDATPAGARAGPAAVPADIRCAATRRTLSRFERAEVHAILDAMTETGGNKKDAAALLGISRSTLYRKLQTAGIDLENTVY
jgi:transcriptional regulator of acetoin/glycerol metabolism